MSLTHVEAASGALVATGKALAAVMALGAAYVAIGLPVPASMSYVDSRVGQVLTSIADLRATVLDGQLRDMAAQRSALNIERGVLVRGLKTAPESERVALEMRVSEIDDALSKLATDSAAIRGKLATREDK